ncbi:MAG: exodeoxyribonuclease VII large subunit [Eggerthellaceae bacterium]|nr:exodeoxyribonuclease VII large subunit [Eggerthellaceae bacterium]
MAEHLQEDFQERPSRDREGRSDALSVSDAMALAKQSLESVVVRIVGEVSEVSVKPGYKAAYFSVKDSSSSLPCMMWNNRYRASGIDLAVGQLIDMTGRFTLYAAKGRMNFDVFSIALAGEGDLRLKVANIAKKLAGEGLTDPGRKIALPAFPERIGLVTSPRSAAVHDVLRTLRRRFPVATVLLAGVPVEGAQAAEGIVEGMRAVYRARPDVILVVRGGGSFEDLMPFNDEALARAIAACPIPVVTGIGHEVDTTIADMVSDCRASTPTAAAEAVSPSRESLDALFASRRAELQGDVQLALERLGARVERVATRPLFSDPMLLFAADAQSLDLASDRLARALPMQVERMRVDLGSAEERLARVMPVQIERCRLEVEGTLNRFVRIGHAMGDRFSYQMRQAASRLVDLSPVNTLARGYSITRNEEGSIVRHVGEAPAGTRIEVTVSDGTLDCEVMIAKQGRDS